MIEIILGVMVFSTLACSVWIIVEMGNGDALYKALLISLTLMSLVIFSLYACDKQALLIENYKHIAESIFIALSISAAITYFCNKFKQHNEGIKNGK